MKFRKLAIYTLAFVLAGAAASCESPLKDFNLQISDEVIKHSAVLQVRDADGAELNSATVRLVGGDTQDIYNLDGKKEFKVLNGMVAFGVTPNRDVMTGAPVTFQVEIAAAGYITQIVNVSITNANNGMQTVTLLKPLVLPEGAAAATQTVALGANGATLTAVSLGVTNASGINIAIAIPAGTQFLDADGNVLVGGTLTATTIGFDPLDPAALALFPGGTLQATGVVGKDGSTSSGTFNPAAATTIEMTVAGRAVRRFSQPIQISMAASPRFNLSTGAPLVSGTALESYSYTPSEPVWKFQQDIAAVGSDAVGYTLSFATDHLTTFVGGEYLQACAPTREITFTGDWIEQGFTYPVTVQAVSSTGQVIATGTYSISEGSETISFSNLPPTGVNIVVRNNAGVIVAQGPLAACGTMTTIAIPAPPGTFVTLQLYVRCPDKTTPITLLPTFQLEYRVSGTSTWIYLGEVNNGFLSTTLLKADGTQYDFRATWKSRTKTVNRKTVQESNLETVGIQPGDIIGEKAGATNLAILTEECGNL